MNKICTSIEQSKKLSEILPPESADMCWQKIYDENHLLSDHRIELIPFRLYSGLGVPAWSLSALLDVLPVGTESHKQSDGSISYYYVEVYNNREYFSTKRYDNPIDAAFEMITLLKESGKL